MLGKETGQSLAERELNKVFPSSSSRPSIIAFKCLAISLGSRKDGQTVDMFSLRARHIFSLDSWKKNNCREFESRRFFSWNKMQRSYKVNGWNWKWNWVTLVSNSQCENVSLEWPFTSAAMCMAGQMQMKSRYWRVYWLFSFPFWK